MDTAATAGWRAVAALYNALLTGTVVSLVARRGSDVARACVFQLFRRQHLEKFLPGLTKLDLAGKPDAVACALYHYHSNALGGVLTEYVRESDTKAWVRYPPPRWMWRGTAIAAIPHEVSAAMLHAWHGHNGVSLGNPRLGFVCTGMTVDGLPGLEGYYFEHARPLAQEERVRFAYGEETMPPFDPSKAPALDTAAWPEERLVRTHRSYAMTYIATLLPVLQELLGPATSRIEFGRVGRLIGLQFQEEAARAMGCGSNQSAGTAESARAFAQWLSAMLSAQGETVELREAPDGAQVSMTGWRLPGATVLEDPLAAFDAWNELWIGACAAHDRFLGLDLARWHDAKGYSAIWKIAPARMPHRPL